MNLSRTLARTTFCSLALTWTALVQATENSLQKPAYFFADFEVTDPIAIKPYSSEVESTFEPFGGTFLIRSGTLVPLEGTAPARRRVVIKFDSLDQARAWYDSPAYQAIKPIRQRSAKADTYLIEGVDP